MRAASFSGTGISPVGRHITGRMRFDRRTASSISQAQISEAAECGEITNTTVSLSAMRPPRRFFQASPSTIECRSIDVSNPITSRPATSSSANAMSAREYEMKTWSFSPSPGGSLADGMDTSGGAGRVTVAASPSRDAAGGIGISSAITLPAPPTAIWPSVSLGHSHRYVNLRARAELVGRDAARQGRGCDLERLTTSPCRVPVSKGRVAAYVTAADRRRRLCPWRPALRTARRACRSWRLQARSDR